MKNFKALTLAALTAAATFAAPAAQARNVDAAHIRLGQAVMATGIELKINPVECNYKPALGWYWAAKNELVICQEKREKIGVETYWTAEDLDTLRHEVQHLIQDCRDGRRDGHLDAVYNKPIALAEAVLGSDRIMSILEVYSDASNHIKVMELEAFSVAAMNDPADQAKDVATYCF